MVHNKVTITASENKEPLPGSKGRPSEGLKGYFAFRNQQQAERKARRQQRELRNDRQRGARARWKKKGQANASYWQWRRKHGNRGLRYQATLRDPQVCEGPDCEEVFQGYRSTRRFCGDTCRKRAKRAQGAASVERAEALGVMDALLSDLGATRRDTDAQI